MNRPLFTAISIASMVASVALALAIIWATCWYAHTTTGDWIYVPAGATIIASVVGAIIACINIYGFCFCRNR